MDHRQGPKHHVFRAALVGEPAFASLPFNSFFPIPPLGPLHPTVLMDPDGWEAINIRDFIADAELVDLDCDVVELPVEQRVTGKTEAEEEVLPEDQGDWFIPIVRGQDGKVMHLERFHSGALRPAPLFLQEMCSDLSGEIREDEEEVTRTGSGLRGFRSATSFLSCALDWPQGKFDRVTPG
jgi:hypothetical protein